MRTGSVTVEAVIANHNTSRFAELALRSLMASEVRGNGGDGGNAGHVLRVTVRDNHSSDGGLDDLVAACKELGATFARSRWPAAGSVVNTHGDLLRDFVLDHADADYVLFLDCDIDVESSRMVATMLAELEADPSLWAVQARFGAAEERFGTGSSLDIRAWRPVELRAAMAKGRGDPEVGFTAHSQPRCHPGCALVRNSSEVRRVAERFGFGVAVVQSADEAVAALFDTLGLASAVLELQGFRYALSAATVHHFFNVSYPGDGIAEKEADRDVRLARLVGAPRTS